MKDRKELIALCEAASVPEKKWINRDSAQAQRQVGECMMLLKAGCIFRPADGNPTSNSRIIWIAIESDGFAFFEGGEVDIDNFYIPTKKRVEKADGGDWY